MTTLTNEEKISIINSHIKNLEYNKFNIAMSIVEENAKSTPDASTLSSLNNQIADLNLQKAALTIELSSLSE